MYKFILFTLFLFSPVAVLAQVYGCTDSLANNFNTSATINDGSCTYDPANVAPLNTYNLPAIIVESSGLINWNNSLWTHNDNTDTDLYELDTLNGSIVATHPLSGITNTDWEEISQDSGYVYIGDFGNNANGNRTDLHILRIDKYSILSGQPIIDTIYFSYADQTNFTPTGGNNTEFDCEAFLVATDSIFLFTKQWVSNESTIYGFPKSPGSYTAANLGSFNVQGLITGLTYRPDLNLIVMIGYSPLVQPFLYLLYDFESNYFFNGNKRKIGVQLPFHQTEGISTADGLKYYVTNEYLSQGPISINQKLHIFNLDTYLEDYINTITSDFNDIQSEKNITVFPNPVQRDLHVAWKGTDRIIPFAIIDKSGIEVDRGYLTVGINAIDMGRLPSGHYFLLIPNGFSYKFSKIK